MIIEMTIVQRPFVLDFGGAYLDQAPEFSEEVIADWQAQKIEQFGERWPEVQAILAVLGSYGIFVQDVHPGTFRLMIAGRCPGHELVGSFFPLAPGVIVPTITATIHYLPGVAYVAFLPSRPWRHCSPFHALSRIGAASGQAHRTEHRCDRGAAPAPAR
jgi:hypothetical protein